MLSTLWYEATIQMKLVLLSYLQMEIFGMHKHGTTIKKRNQKPKDINLERSSELILTLSSVTV